MDGFRLCRFDLTVSLLRPPERIIHRLEEGRVEPLGGNLRFEPRAGFLHACADLCQARFLQFFFRGAQ